MTVPFLFLAVAACAQEPEFEDTEYTAVCVNQETKVREDDSHCPSDQTNNNSSNLLLWYFLLRQHQAPAVGQPVNMSHGSFVKPAGSVGLAPARGGFGTRSVSVGG